MQVQVLHGVPFKNMAKNKIINAWGAWGAANKKTAADQRRAGIKARAQRSDAGKKRKP